MEAELGSVPHELPGDAGPAAGTAAATAPKKSKAKVIKKDTMHNVNPDLKVSTGLSSVPPEVPIKLLAVFQYDGAHPVAQRQECRWQLCSFRCPVMVGETEE